MAGSAGAVREVAGEPWADSAPVSRAEAGAALTVREVVAGPDGSREPLPTASDADPCSEADALEELGDEIVRLAAHLHAGTGRMLGLLADFDRREGWKAGGHASCAHWLSVRAGYRLRTARSHLRVARALEALPRIGEALAAGRLSFCQARALVRVATPGSEEALLELAEGCTVQVLERRVRAWRRGTAEDEAERAERLHRDRRLSVVPDEDGGYRVHGRLEPEVGALLMRAIEAAADALYRTEREGEPNGSYEPPSPRRRLREAARRRADALGLLAERALAAGFGGEEAPVSGTRAERYQVFVHVDRPLLAGEEEETDRAGDEDEAGEAAEPRRSELADGTRLAPGTARRLACDAATVQVSRGAGGSVLDVGRRRRTVPPALRRALEVRDGGCRFPGCGLRFTDAHHVRPWAEGGETSLENLLLLCRRHHRLLHEEGWTVEWWGKRAVFRDPADRLHTDTGWEAPELPDDPVASLVRENRLNGADPGPMDPTARWKRERSVPDTVWFAAHEATLGGLAEEAPP